jgi:UDP-glucuronate 4-epimerase
MKILLTGGAGFIGSTTAAALLDRGVKLAILDNLNPYYDPSIKERNLAEVRGHGSFELWRQDLLDAEQLRSRFRRFLPDTVIHLAARAGVRPSLEQPGLYHQVNVVGTINLLESCRQFGVGRFIFGSTSAVYGIRGRTPFREDDPLDCMVSPYAVSKRAAELMCFVYHHNFRIPVCCLRFFTVYGPRQRPDMAIHRFARRILKGEEIPLYHEGRSSRDYTYVDDIVAGILAAAEFGGGFEIINLGNSRTVRLLELVHLLEQTLGKPARVRLEPAQPGDVPLTCADNSKAAQLLGWSPQVPLEQGLKRFAEWIAGEGSKA